MRILTICCFLLAGLVLAAQSSRIEYFTVTDGLSTREINDLHIGSSGYLWVGTMDGLNRFDGHSFLTFGPRRRGGAADDRGQGLSRGAIRSVREANDGRLVIAFQDFYGYFDLFDPRDFSVETVRLVLDNGIRGYPREIVTDGLGRTFVVTIGQGGGTVLYEYTRRGFQVVFQAPDDGWRNFTPRVELLPLRNGQFLLYDDEHGFRHISARGELLGSFFPRTSTQRRFYMMAEGPQGFVYLSFRDGYPLFRWQPRDPERQPVPVPDLDSGLRYTRIFRDEEGQLLFLATEDILTNAYPEEYYLVDTSGSFVLFERDLPTDREVTTVAAINFRRTVYLGLREGLGVMERYVKPITNHLSSSIAERRRDLYRHNVTGIAGADSGRVFILTEKGELYTRGPDGGELSPRLLVDSSGRALTLRAAQQLLYDSRRASIWGVAERLDEPDGGVLFRYDINGGYTEAYGAPYSLTCLALAPDGGGVYVGASDPRRVGLLLFFAPERKEWTELSSTLIEDGIPELARLRINYLLMAADGRLLIGTRNRGLVTLYPPTGKVTFYDRRDGGPGPRADLLATTVYVIHEDSLARWWLGTDAGLYVVDSRSGNVDYYGRQDGLSNNNVVGILPDSSGGYWLSTHNGLVHLPTDPGRGTPRRYFTEDGLANDRYNTFAFHRDRAGRYYFGGGNGLSTFTDTDLSQDAAGSGVMITEVVIYGRRGNRTLSQNLNRLRRVTVAANEKSIAISFALPVGQRPRLTQLRVKLEGFDEEWRELRNERTVRYNNLPSGNYQLLVQAADANGNYGEQRLSLAIGVKQYIIERTWFQILIALLVAGLFFYILQGRLRERLRNEQLRTQLSSDIHDEVSGLLAGITLQAELLQGRTEDEQLQERLRTVGEAGRNAMSKMSDVIWSIDSRRDTIGNLLQRMQEHADEVLLPLDIRYDFTAAGFDREDQLAGNIRQDLYFIYKEAINNIARHSNATHVQIELEQFGQTFEMYIRDNGSSEQAPNGNGKANPGRFTPKTGQGTDNMRMRAQRLNAEFLIDARAGYTLTLRMRRLG